MIGWTSLKASWPHGTMNAEKIHTNIAQAAYFLLKHGYYGSERKAVSALRRRKDTRQCDSEFLASSLANAISMVHRLDVLAASVLRKHSKSYHPQLTKDEFMAGRQSLKQALLREFPDSEIEIDYLMAMLWDMPYLR